MMNRIFSIIKIALLFIPVVIPGTSLFAAGGELNIKSIGLAFPTAATPFYHFEAALQLPNPSMIEVEATVNGKVLRFLNIHKSGIEDPNRPALTHRPPSGAGLSQDNSLYGSPTVIGWVKWQPGEKYVIRLTVRLKKGVQHSKQDVLLTAVKTVTAPVGAQVFDPAWKNYKAVVLSETAGIERKAETVDMVMAFYPDEAKDLKRDVRVVAVDPETHALTEVPSQVFDIQEYLVSDDLAPDKNGKPTREVPVWLPTVSVRLSFLADVPARKSRVYLVYYNNEAALAKTYVTDLRVVGEAPGLRIENDHLLAVLHPHSGHLDQITLKKLPQHPLFHRMETNGAIHWNPEVYAPPAPWTHTSDWKPAPNNSVYSGPVKASSEVWGGLRDIPAVDAAVRYEFFPGKPYFMSSSVLRINESVQTLALRNGEIVFKRELITHAAWYDVVRDSIIQFDVTNMPDLTDLKMEADVPWISFYNEKTGIGFAGIQLSYANAGLESSPRLLNPFFYITGGPWIYWARALSLSFLSSNMQQMIPALKGNVFTEKWAYLVYEIDKGNKPFAPVIHWQKQLTNPLRIQLVEEVDDRVSKTVTELFVGDGKSGWEERETGRHKNDK